jgi:propanol-preferring alcohol dehydrogenase
MKTVPGFQYPVVPGHEMVGIVVQVGAAAKRYQVGHRVGAGWHGGHCFACESCLRGDFLCCARATVTGIHVEGGYAEYMVAKWDRYFHTPFLDHFSTRRSLSVFCCSRLIPDGDFLSLLFHYSLAMVPDGMSPTRAAPLLCAGVTVFNSIKEQQIPPGSLVAVQGIGGLGHYAIQFARKMGFRVAALSMGNAKEELALQLGAHRTMRL